MTRAAFILDALKKTFRVQNPFSDDGLDVVHKLMARVYGQKDPAGQMRLLARMAAVYAGPIAGDKEKLIEYLTPAVAFFFERLEIPKEEFVPANLTIFSAISQELKWQINDSARGALLIGVFGRAINFDPTICLTATQKEATDQKSFLLGVALQMLRDVFSRGLMATRCERIADCLTAFVLYLRDMVGGENSFLQELVCDSRKQIIDGGLEEQSQQQLRQTCAKGLDADQLASLLEESSFAHFMITFEDKLKEAGLTFQ